MGGWMSPESPFSHMFFSNMYTEHYNKIAFLKSTLLNPPCSRQPSSFLHAKNLEHAWLGAGLFPCPTNVGIAGGTLTLSGDTSGS